MPVDDGPLGDASGPWPHAHDPLDPRPVRRGAKRRAEARRAKAVAGPWAPVVDVPEGDLMPYLRCCAHNPRRPQSYWLYTWKVSDPGKRTRMPYRCGSWRCPYGCREFAGHLLYARIVESFQAIDPSELVCMVLTLPGLEHVKARSSSMALEAVYSDLLGRKEKFWSRLRRLHERRGWEWIGSSYVTVVEQHASGVPHVNLLVHSPQWAAELRASQPPGWLFDAEISLHAQETGWGWRCTAEPIRLGNVNKLAGYLVKLAGRTDAMHGELAKACQLPVKAPRHFRRLRAGRRFLVPRRRKPGFTGTIVRRKWTEDGDEMVLPLVLSSNAEYMQRVRECCEREKQLALEDETRRSMRVARAKLQADGRRTRQPLDEWLDDLAKLWAAEQPLEDVSSHMFRREPEPRSADPP